MKPINHQRALAPWEVKAGFAALLADVAKLEFASDTMKTYLRSDCCHAKTTRKDGLLICSQCGDDCKGLCSPEDCEGHEYPKHWSLPAACIHCGEAKPEPDFDEPDNYATPQEQDDAARRYFDR